MKTKDIIGKKFGRLTAIAFKEKRHQNHQYWVFKCDCGNLHTAAYFSVKRGDTKSCGCLRNENSKKMCQLKYLGKGVSGFNQVKANYMRKAKKRKIKFNLSDKQLHLLFEKKCYYCEISPYKSKSDYIYNGIDRVDNDNGYLIENCVSCCYNCNIIKSGVTKNIIIKSHNFLFKG